MAIKYLVQGKLESEGKETVLPLAVVWDEGLANKIKELAEEEGEVVTQEGDKHTEFTVEVVTIE